MPNLPDPVLIVAVLGTIALTPFVALLVTSYTKIVIVLGLLRMALGTQQVPPNMVLNGIAIILTIFVLAPVGMQAADTLKTVQFSKGTATFDDYRRVADAVVSPMRQFLDQHTEERERRFFMRTAERLWPPERAQALTRDDLLILVPSFTLSELIEAFQIGFLLYLAFVVVDLLIGNVLLALGMSMVSPTVVSVPFKLLLFIALDGWSLLMQGLLLSYKVA
jgi:type III secretion protein R